MKEVYITASVPARNEDEKALEGTIVTKFPEISNDSGEPVDFNLAWKEIETLATRETLLKMIWASFKIDVQSLIRSRLKAGRSLEDLAGVVPGQEFKAVPVDPKQAAYNYIMSLSAEERAAYIRELKAAMG